MPFQLDIQHENMSYKGHYTRPPLELWGKGGSIIQWILDALAPFGVTLRQIKFGTNQASLTDSIVLAEIPDAGQIRFSFERIEFEFARFSQEFFEKIPGMMDALVKGLTSTVANVKFASHGFVYFCHSLVKNGTAEQVLKAINTTDLNSAGISLGNGAIFNYTVPAKAWETQLTVDRSKFIPGGLFLSLEVKIGAGEINYTEVVTDARQYLRAIMQELNLSFPEIEG